MIDLFDPKTFSAFLEQAVARLSKELLSDWSQEGRSGACPEAYGLVRQLGSLSVRPSREGLEVYVDGRPAHKITVAKFLLYKDPAQNYNSIVSSEVASVGPGRAERHVGRGGREPSLAEESTQGREATMEKSKGIEIEKLMDIVNRAGVEVTVQAAYNKLTTHADSSFAVYVPTNTRIVRSRVHFSGFDFSHPALKRIGEEEARELRMGRVRGELDFSQDEPAVLEAFRTGLELMKVLSQKEHDDRAAEAASIKEAKEAERLARSQELALKKAHRSAEVATRSKAPATRVRTKTLPPKTVNPSRIARRALIKERHEAKADA